ncbi:MAG: hypothetical protein JWM93_171, partial [Frankiales bacterium]|nr:hypothetical protein [Frankiales bacterium]
MAERGSVSLAEARRLAISAQGLAASPVGAAGMRQLTSVVERI